jgi:hypothetical protein
MMFSFLKRQRGLLTPEYQLWRQQFMQKRLSLGMRIAFFYFVTLLGEQLVYLLFRKHLRIDSSKISKHFADQS